MEKIKKHYQNYVPMYINHSLLIDHNTFKSMVGLPRFAPGMGQDGAK